jgi:hypothetical protein
MSIVDQLVYLLAGSYASERKKLSTDAQLYDIIGSVIDCKEVLTGFKLRHACTHSLGSSLSSGLFERRCVSSPIRVGETETSKCRG